MDQFCLAHLTQLISRPTPTHILRMYMYTGCPAHAKVRSNP